MLSLDIESEYDSSVDYSVYYFSDDFENLSLHKFSRGYESDSIMVSIHTHRFFSKTVEAYSSARSVIKLVGFLRCVS